RDRGPVVEHARSGAPGSGSAAERRPERRARGAIMSEGVIAERYAQALFELGVESGQLSELADRVRDFAQVYAGNKELQQTLSNPVIEEAKREAVLSEVARRVGVPDLGVKGLVLMARRRRL